MKERKELLNQETAEQVRGAAETIAEALPEDALEQVAGAGNPFENSPRVPTAGIDEDLRGKA